MKYNKINTLYLINKLSHKTLCYTIFDISQLKSNVRETLDLYAVADYLLIGHIYLLEEISTF